MEGRFAGLRDSKKFTLEEAGNRAEGDLAFDRLSSHGRGDERDQFPAISPIDTKIVCIHSDNAVSRVEFTEPDEAKIRKVGSAVGIPFG